MAALAFARVRVPWLPVPSPRAVKDTNAETVTVFGDRAGAYECVACRKSVFWRFACVILARGAVPCALWLLAVVCLRTPNCGIVCIHCWRRLGTPRPALGGSEP